MFDATALFVNLWVIAIALLPFYHFTRRSTARKMILTAFGGLLLFYVAPRLVLLYFWFWMAVVLAQRLVVRSRVSDRLVTPVLLCCTAGILAPMVAWKVWPDWFMLKTALAGNAAVAAVFPTVGWLDAQRTLLLPIGLSFATFRAIDLLMQTYTEQVDRLPVLDILAYGFCPFLLAVGPIATLQEVDHDRVATSFDVKYGLYRILAGLFKIYVVAALLEPWSGVFHAAGNRPGWQVFLGLYVFALQFYCNFAGYSDLAIGSGRLFGMSLPENFRWPLLRESPQQFWANWHASLSRFAQRYVFTVAGGQRRGREYPALLATMMVIAWWHELNGPWTAFGLYHGTGLVVHRWWTRLFPAGLTLQQAAWYRVLSWLLLLTFVALGFPIISLPLSELPTFYAGLLK